jgi:DNA-directed RNA polymerase specialized sigma24 family protein
MAGKLATIDLPDVVQQFLSGHAELNAQIDGILRRGMATTARHLVSRYRINAAVYDAEDAINDALFELAEAGRAGRLSSVRNYRDLLTVLRSILARRILGELDREWALKRGGPSKPPRSQQLQVGATRDGGSARRYHRQEALRLDEIEDTVAYSPLEVTSARLERERLLEHLSDPAEKAILEMRIEHRTNLEIAQALGKSLSFVDRRLASTRSTWQRINGGPT